MILSDRPGQHEDVNPQSSRTSKLNRYEVTLSHGNPFFILAFDSMHAAYLALGYSTDRDNKLINVRLTHD